MLNEIIPHVYCATKAVKVIPLVRIQGSMFVIRTEAGLLFVDPFELSPNALSLLEGVGQPHMIILTTGAHQRDAATYRDRFAIPLLAHRDLEGKLKVPLDRTFDDGEEIAENLWAIAMQGTLPGETVLHLSREEGCLIAGDALMNMAPGSRHWLSRLIGTPEGLGTMPTRFIKDRERAARAYEALLQRPFAHLLVSHGEPVLGEAQRKLEETLRATFARS